MPTASRILSATASLATGLLLTACIDGSGRDDASGLVVAVDHLADLDGDKLTADGIIDPDRELVPGTRITMAFTADSVSVNAGCNTFTGIAAIDDYELVLGHLTATKRACEDALEDQDRWLMAFLTSRPRFEHVDDDFYFSRDDTVIHLLVEP